MQTADKIQAALLCVQIFVAIVQLVTTLFFIRSVGITQQQEKDAKNQILLAQRQMDLMAAQYRESLRPLIAVTHRDTGSNFIVIELRNEGLGPALKVECDPQISLQGIVIGSKSSVLAHVPIERMTAGPPGKLFALTYKSLDGQEYATCFYQKYEQFSVVDYRHIGSDVDRAVWEQFRGGFVAGIK